MSKVIKILILLNITITLFSSEKEFFLLNKEKIQSNGSNLLLKSLNIENYAKINIKTQKINKVKPGVFKITGIALTAAGGASGVIGGTLIGISYYLAWYNIAALLGSTNFTIKSWYWIWSLVFNNLGYIYSTSAFLTLILGITLTALSIAIIPGIILLVYGSLQVSKGLKLMGRLNIKPIDDKIGISIGFN